MKRLIAAIALLPALTAPAFVAAQSGPADSTETPTRAANQIRPFSMAALQAAQAAGRPILVDVYASWCPICRAQAPVIAALAADPANANVLFLRLDFDRQRSERNALRATSQSTLIAFRGRTETGRLQGVTDAGQIGRLVAGTRR